MTTGITVQVMLSAANEYARSTLLKEASVMRYFAMLWWKIAFVY